MWRVYKLTTDGSSKSGFRRKRAILIDFWRKRAFSSTFFTFSKSCNNKFGKNVDENAKFRQNSIENYCFFTFFRGVNFRRPYLPRFEAVFDNFCVVLKLSTSRINLRRRFSKGVFLIERRMVVEGRSRSYLNPT